MNDRSKGEEICLKTKERDRLTNLTKKKKETPIWRGKIVLGAVDGERRRGE